MWQHFSFPLFNAKLLNQNNSFGAWIAYSHGLIDHNWKLKSTLTPAASVFCYLRFRSLFLCCNRCQTEEMTIVHTSSIFLQDYRIWDNKVSINTTNRDCFFSHVTYSSDSLCSCAASQKISLHRSCIDSEVEGVGEKGPTGPLWPFGHKTDIWVKSPHRHSWFSK